MFFKLEIFFKIEKFVKITPDMAGVTHYGMAGDAKAINALTLILRDSWF